MEKKAKISICKKCWYWIPVRAESCRRCLTPAEKKEEMKLQVKKINTEQKSDMVRKPKKPVSRAKASPSGARTTGRKPKSKRSWTRRTSAVRSQK